MTYGINSTLSVTFQNSYGTSLTNSRYYIPFMSEGFSPIKEALISGGMNGRFDEGQLYEGKNSSEGTLECEVNPIAIGALLKAFLGAPTTSQATSAAVYTHKFNPRTTDFDDYAANFPVSILKHLGDSGSAHLFYDMVGNKLSMSIANGEFLKCTAEFVGGKYTQIANPSATTPSGKNFTWDACSVSIGGTANSDLTDMTIEIDNAIENKWTLSAAKTPSRAKRNGPRICNVNGTIVFDSQTEFQQFLNQSERSLIITMTGPVEISSGYKDVIKVEVPLFRYSDFKPVANGTGKLEVGFASKAVYSTTSATAITFWLTNTQTAY